MMAHSWDRNQQTFANGFFLRNEETVKKRKNWEPIKNLSINQSINQSKICQIVKLMKHALHVFTLTK